MASFSKRSYIPIFVFSILALLVIVISFGLFRQNLLQDTYNAKITSLPTQTQTPTLTPTTQTLKFNHIFLYVLENHSADQIIGSTDAPTLTSIAHKYVNFTNYENIFHPSLPNYIALTSGSNYGITSDCTSCYINVKNLGSLMDSNNVSWKGYMESMPSPCFIGSAYPYAQKHDPFIYYNDIRTSPTCKDHVVPYSQLTSDINSGSIPSFAFITPNLCNDMHDCSVQTGDNWIKNSLNLIMNSSGYKDNGLIIITFDESESNGNIPAILISENIKKRTYTNTVNHYSILRLIEDNFNLPYLGNSASAVSINTSL